MNGSTSGVGKISSELLARLERNDQTAWFEFLQRVFAAARSAINEALSGPTQQAGAEALRLVHAYDRDPADVHVALDLAWTSFRGRFLDRNWSAAGLQTESDCAACLIGVAYNQWQRQRYHDQRVARQAALGSAAGPDSDGPDVLSQHADHGPGPEDDVDLGDFLAVMGQVLQKFVQPFSEEDRRIIHLSHYERKTPREIQELVGVSLTRCQELPRLWRLHLTQRFPQTLDFLKPDDKPNLVG